MWIQVESSNIDAIAHQHDKLFVRFRSGAEYVYDGVTKDTFREIVEAESIGSRFHHLVKKHPDIHPFKRLN